MAPTEPQRSGFLRLVRRSFREGFRSAQLPDIGVTVEVPAGGISISTAESVSKAVQQSLDAAAASLGIPAKFLVQLKPSADAGSNPRMIIAGRPARIVPDELSDALAAQGLTTAALQSGDAEGFAEAVMTACQVAVEWDPSILVATDLRGPVLSRAWLAGIRDIDQDVLASALLDHVIAYGISIADLSLLKAALDNQADLIETPGELAEIAVEALRPRSLTVSVPEAVLRTATLTGTRSDAFRKMPGRLFVDLGITFPPIEVEVDDTLTEQMAVVTLNHVRFNPRPLPRDAGVGHIASVMERQLRNHAGWFVSLAEVRRTIEGVGPALPDMVTLVQERYSDPELAVFARTFVEERVPVRNAARLMMLLLDTPAEGTGRDLARLAEPTRGAGVGTARPLPRQLVSFTRQTINEEATRSKPGIVTAGPARLPADLDAALTATPAAAGWSHDEGDRSVLNRLMDLAQVLVERGDPTLVAATQSSRAAAKDILIRQFPEVAVFAAEEYPPSWRLRPE